MARKINGDEELVKKIRQANRRMERERQRQIAAEVIAEASGEPVKIKMGEWGKTALNFAEKEVERIAGKGARSFPTTGELSEDMIADLEAAVDRVLRSPMLTEEGRMEQAKANTANFFHKDPSEVTRREMNLLSRLDETGLLDKMKELNMNYSAVFDSLEMGSDFANRKDISLTEKIDFLDALVNNTNGFQEQFTVNGVIDYYGALGEYFGSDDFRD